MEAAVAAAATSSQLLFPAYQIGNDSGTKSFCHDETKSKGDNHSHHQNQISNQSGGGGIRGLCAKVFALCHRARKAYKQHRREVAATPEACACPQCAQKERLNRYYRELAAESAAGMVGAPVATTRAQRR